MALHHSPDYQKSLKFIGILVQEKKSNINFQDSGHLGFPIRAILATFDLPLYFWFRIKKLKIDFQHGCQGDYLDIQSE